MVLTEEQLWCLTHPEQAELGRWVEVKDEIKNLDFDEDKLSKKLCQIRHKINRDGYLCIATSIRQVLDGGQWPACTTKCTFYKIYHRDCMNICGHILEDRKSVV